MCPIFSRTLAAGCLALGAAAAAGAQKGVPAKEAPPEKPGAEKPGAEKSAAETTGVGAAAGPKQGSAPVRVELGDPVQPMQVEVRDGARVEPDPRARYRTLVRMMVNIERAHRDRVARLERLRVLLEAAGAADKVATVARLRDLERTRYEAALEGYERGLGPSLYAQVRAVLDAGGGAPPAPAQSAPAPADGASAGSKRAGLQRRGPR